MTNLLSSGNASLMGRSVVFANALAYGHTRKNNLQGCGVVCIRGGFLSAVGPCLGAVNAFRTNCLSRDCYCCGLRSLCRNPDSQRLCLLDFGGRIRCVGWCSLPRGKIEKRL